MPPRFEHGGMTCEAGRTGAQPVSRRGPVINPASVLASPVPALAVPFSDEKGRAAPAEGGRSGHSLDLESISHSFGSVKVVNRGSQGVELPAGFLSSCARGTPADIVTAEGSAEGPDDVAREREANPPALWSLLRSTPSYGSVVALQNVPAVL
jgi:hypothetical protein